MEPKIELDLLHHVEGLTQELDKSMEKSSRSALKRYPLTFALLTLFGVLAVSDGLKGILKDLGIFEGHPVVLVLVGLLILTITGTLYKKLGEKKAH
ncbi:hypothetical protein KW785_03410 [Candidatus Parcubacteria bacterium]|nr:hypothetical protein [Candidatus Parcubacteria bacterium]